MKGNNQFWLLAGASLGIAILLRPSNIPTIPAYFLAVAIIAVSSKQLVSFTLSFSWVFFGSSILWGWYASNASNDSFSGIPIIPNGIIGTYSIIILLCISPILLSPTNQLVLAFYRVLDKRNVLHLMRLGLLVLCVVVIRKIYQIALTNDPRFLITNLGMAKNRMFHTGSLIDGYQQVDLEVTYFDLRVQIAVIVFMIALGAFLYKRSSDAVRIFGVVSFILLPIFMAVSYMGYVRYASQALPFVPISVVALIQLLPHERFFRQAFLVSSLICLAVPVIPRLPGVIPVPRYAQLGDSNNLLTEVELAMANDLLPLKSTVYIGGPLVSLLAQQLDRRDLVWTWIQPTESEIKFSSSDFFVLYNPMEPFLEKNVLNRGISISECSILRFQRLQLSLCRLLTR
jgi:hypothetical protein